MNHQNTPKTASQPRFKVRPGLWLEAQLGGAEIAAKLSIDEALTLAMILLYEAREQVDLLQAKAGKQ